MKVKVYSTPNCPACHMTKVFLKMNNIEFGDIDVSKDTKAANEMIEKSEMMAVPVIDVDGKIIVGFNVPALKKALKLK